jgi:protein phosphatase
MVIHGAVRTKQGKVRHTNEDAFGFFPDLHLYVVADGLGGHVGGEIASTLTVDTIRRCLQAAHAREEQELVFPAHSTEPPIWGGWKLFSAVERANARVFEESCRQPGLTGMGTTVAALYFDKPYDFVTLCHVGDTRVYRIRAGMLERLTEDHSLGQQLVQTGKLDKRELAAFPYRRLLTQAVGIRPTVYPEIRVEALKLEDILSL